MPDHPLFDFTGGWNTRKPPVLLAENELERADNIRIVPGGGFSKRRGHIIVGNDDASVTNITGLYPFVTPTGTKYLVRTKNAKIEYVASAGTWTDITGGLTVTTTGNLNKHAFAVFRGYVVGTNGTDTPWKWNGTGNAAVIAQAIAAGADTIDKAAAITLHKEHIVLGDVTATEATVQSRYESVIWPSNVGTLDTWDAAPVGKIHVGQGDGDTVTCLLSTLGYLIVFKQNSIWRVSDYGITGTQLLLRVAGVGTPSKHGAVVGMGGIVYFMTAEGHLYSYDPRQGDSPDALTEYTTDKIGEYHLGRLALNAMDRIHLTYWRHSQEIVCFVDDQTVTPEVAAPGQICAWVFSIPAQAWARWIYGERMNVSTYGIDPTDPNATTYQVPLFGSNKGFVRRADIRGTDSYSGSATIAMNVYLAPVHCGFPGTYKWWRFAYLYTNSRQTDTDATDAPTSDTFTLYQDEVLPATGSVVNTFTVTQAAQAGSTTDMYDSVGEARLSGYGRFVRFRIAHATNERTRVSGILLNYETTGPRR